MAHGLKWLIKYTLFHSSVASFWTFFRFVQFLITEFLLYFKNKVKSRGKKLKSITLYKTMIKQDIIYLK